MSQAKWGLVWNPSKGEQSELEAALELTDEQKAALTWYETDEEDSGVAAVKKALADGCAVVFASGGDGTVRVVAEGLAGTEAELAVIPQGTGNLLARNLSIPLSSPADALAFAVEHEARELDVAWVEIVDGEKKGKYAFTVMAGLGVDAHLMAETKDELKEKAGWLAYVEALGRALNSASVVKATITIDDGEAQEVDAHTIMIANCGTIQGGITLFPEAEPDDGDLDMLILNADSALGWLDTLKTMVWDHGIARHWNKDKPESSTTTFERLKKVDIVLSEPVRFQIDGDELGEVTHLTVTIAEKALRTRA